MESWVKIWTEIAEAFDTVPCKYGSGLCLALCYANQPRSDGHAIMGHINRKKNPHEEFWWRTPPYDNDIRATFAGLMAAMGNKGFADFLKWCEEHP